MGLRANNSTNYNINFKMLHKSAMTPIQRCYAESFHVDLSKLHTIGEMEKQSDEMFKCLVKRAEEDGIGRMDDMKSWINGLTSFFKSAIDGSFWKTLAYNSMNKIEHYVPLFDLEIVQKAINEISQSIVSSKNNFCFSKVYSNLLLEKALQKHFPNNVERTGWVKFPHKEDPAEFNDVVEDIRRSSIGTTWCTKSSCYAICSVDRGNFYIYYDKGVPVRGIRTEFDYRNHDIEYTYENKNVQNEVGGDSRVYLNSLQEKYPNVRFRFNNQGMLD